MSWVSENKFLTGFGAVMLVGVGTLGYLTYSAMDKADTATSAFEAANSQLKKLYESKPGLVDSNLKQLVAQKTELSEKIAAFKAELKGRVLKTEAISKVAFQDKLKNSVSQINAKAAAANVERPKDFYLGFDRYQSQPPDDKATAALDWELRAIEALMNVLIGTGSIELDEFTRDPLPEEGGGKAGKQRGAGEHGIERATLKLKMTLKDNALRSVLTGLANHKQQLFIIRNVAIQNKAQDSPQRVPPAGGAPSVPPVSPNSQPTGNPPVPGAPTPTAPTPAPGDQSSPTAPAPTTPSPAAPNVSAPPSDGGLNYIFGAEKITATVDLEILNFVEPKADSGKPEKGGNKKEK